MKLEFLNRTGWRYFFLISGVVVFWMCVLTALAAQLVNSGAFFWKDAVLLALSHWLPWIFLSPVIVWFTYRFPIERAGGARRIGMHLLAGLASVILCAAVEYNFAPPIPLPWAQEKTEAFPGLPPKPSEMPGAFLNEDSSASNQGPLTPPFWFHVQFNLPIYFIFTTIGHAYSYFRRSQQRERRALELEANLAQARLQSLRMQLHPHFLFNTLNAISTLVYTDARAADEMIGGLSEMLRLSLDSATEQEVPFARELLFLNRYLQIEQTRFGDRLRVEQNVSPEALGAWVPTLILQPLVENAIRHGIEPKLAPGLIGISAQRVGESLRISIRDTGIGLPAEKSAGQVPQKGIGLDNTRARLQSLYPNQHRFALRNDPAGGCIAELEIPFHLKSLSGEIPRS